MKFYLAHATKARHYIREWELGFEARTGIELVNPFYDANERMDIKDIDAGKKSVFDRSLDYERLVEGDLRAIAESDGLVSWVKDGMSSIGTFHEQWETYRTYKGTKPVYVVCETPEWTAHPWLRYVTEKTGGFIVATLQEFEEKLRTWCPKCLPAIEEFDNRTPGAILKSWYCYHLGVRLRG